MKKRRATFQLEALRPVFDGQAKATVILDQDGPHILVRVRPHRRKHEAVENLSDVAERILWRDAEARARAKKVEKAAKGRRR